MAMKMKPKSNSNMFLKFAKHQKLMNYLLMKKMKLLLIMSVVAMLVLCGCTKDKETNNDDRVQKVPVREELINVENAVSVKYTDNTTIITLVDVNGVWYFEGDMETWVDQVKAYDIVQTASILKSVDLIEDAGALADYGLETAAYTVVVTDGAGNETTIYIGYSLEDGTYYATIGEKDQVYIIGGQLAAVLEFDIQRLIDPNYEEYIEEEYIEEEYIEDEYIEEEILDEDIMEEEEEVVEDDSFSESEE